MTAEAPSMLYDKWPLTLFYATTPEVPHNPFITSHWKGFSHVGTWSCKENREMSPKAGRITTAHKIRMLL